MEWKDLLLSDRLGRGASTSAEVRSQYQRDFDRIVFSTAFRRLQDKTQVFPLAESDYVRTRLTHSIEVSSVGRSLGTLIGGMVREHEQSNGVAPQEFGNIVAAACLAHDIGNPPFGHSGEQAIRAWFESRGCAFLETLTPAETQDLLKFEGNAQGFRVLTRLQNSQNAGGLQLTYAVLGAYTKYPKQSVVPGMEKSKKVSEKKFGIYQAELPHFREIADKLGLLPKRNDAWVRHPLTFLVEAADDICYRVIDFEDGCRLGRVSFSEAEPLLRPIAFPKAEKEATNSYDSIEDTKGKIEYLRARAINTLIYGAADTFRDNYERIMRGEFEDDLISHSPFLPQLRKIKEQSVSQVYATPSVVHIEAAGFEVLGGLLGRIVPALVGDEGTRTAQDDKVRQLIPPQFRAGNTKYEKLLAATDFVSGMTDSFAVTLYRRLSGIELPSG
ncbi:MAG: deoxyguanosinetriphosphate triphosphohydrolase [Betaproteobacteria bacterium]|nr:MAG: deoxyguanosinetriphosphate triphosphohydrolase [Betaproteobacteria bacterium]